jgi:hypothetical protein
MTVRTFAEHLGVAVRTITNWETQGPAIRPYADSQAILDTALARSSADEQARFHQTLAVGHRSAASVPPVLDYETWTDDLDRAVLGLGVRTSRWPSDW